MTSHNGSHAQWPCGTRHDCELCEVIGNKISCADLEKMFELELKDSLIPVLKLFTDHGSLANERAEIRTRMTSLEDLYSQGAVTLERFSERQKELENEETNLIKKPSQKSSSSSQELDSKEFLRRWPSFPFDQRLKIVQLLIDQVIVCRDTVEFLYRIPDSPKDAPTNQQTPAPTHVPTGDSEQPIYIRLPKQGELCPLSGFSRSKFNELVLENPRNNHRPPVKSKSTRKKGSMRGTRLILRQSLIDYLENLPDG